MYRRKRELPNLDKMAEVGITRKYWRYARCSVIAGLCAAMIVSLATGCYLVGYTKGMSFESFSLARKSRPPLPVSVQPVYRSTTSNDSTNPRTPKPGTTQTVGKPEVPAKLEPGSFSPITVSLVSPQKDSIKVGDMIHYRIVCRDKSGDLPSSGGGYWAAIFDSKSNPKASTAGRVVDHKNGTYSINVYAGWAGQGTLSVVRVLSPEAGDFMNNTVWPAADRVVWWGVFEPPKGDRESKLCWLKRGNFTDMCVYPNPKAIGKTVFACLKPTRVDCKYLTMTKSDSRRMNDRMGHITRQKAGLVNKAKSHLRDEIKIVDPTVTISGPPIAADPALPKCLPGQNRPLGDGYWLEGKWKTLLCEYTDWSEQSKLLSCMKNRQFYYFGDSTTRQWFLNTLEMIGRKFQMRLGIDLPGRFWERYYEDIDMRIVFTFHKQIMGSHLVKLNETNYEVDLIEGFNDTRCNYVIMVSPWAHFTNWAKESYIERTWLLRESLIRFRRRCPKAKIILKGPHAKQATRSTINSADYINKGIEEVNRKALEDIGVWFLPTWDLNLAHPIRNTIHMPPPLIVAELKVFFSYVCGDSEIPPLNV